MSASELLRSEPAIALGIFLTPVLLALGIENYVDPSIFRDPVGSGVFAGGLSVMAYFATQLSGSQGKAAQ